MTRAFTLTFLAALAGSALLADAAQAQQPRRVLARGQAVAQPLPGALLPVAVPPTFDPVVASLPPRCPEGRTSTGECVNPILGQIARRTATVDTAAAKNIKRDLDLEYGRRASSYVPQPYHPYGGPGTPFPYTYPIFFH